MPNGHGPKEYGEHKYPGSPHQTSDCEYGCGCWAGHARSGGPTGIDPFGTCFKNPKDGKLLGGNADYDHVVNQRIHDLEQRAFKAEEALKRVSPGEIKLTEENVMLKQRMATLEQSLRRIRDLTGEE